MKALRKISLDQYALTIPLCLSPFFANGQIIYTDPFPDIEGGIGDTIELDLNQDGGIDITILDDLSHIVGSDGYGNGYAFYIDEFDIIVAGGGKVFCDYDLYYPTELDPVPVPYGQMLSADLNWLSDNDQVLFAVRRSGNSIQFLDGNLTPNEFEYIGIKTFIDYAFHYGWIRLKTNTMEGSYTIDSYAINQVPRGPIKAGQTNQLNYSFQVIQSGSNIIAVTPELMDGENYHLQIVNNLGEVIYQNDITIEESFSVDLNGIPNGIYFIVLDNGAIKRSTSFNYIN
jgi:hypothetical protein